MRITSLIENTSARGLPTEHGLSLFVEMADACFLFDMGQTDRFARNAQTLGIDLNAADFAVLSHGHYDHGDGMKTFLSANDHAPVYVSRYAFEPHYNAAGEYIGLDQGVRDSERIIPVDGVTQIRQGMTLHGAGQFKAAIDASTRGMQVLRDGAMAADDFRHEQYLLVEEGGKRILFSGCSHRGILNIMRWFAPDVLIGGFHLFRQPVDGALADCARALDAYETEYYTCHCTGVEQYEYMKRFMGRLHYLSAGESIAV